MGPQDGGCEEALGKIGRPAAGRSRGVVSLENTTGYESKDLKSFFDKGARAMGQKGLHVRTVISPGRSRGCATVGGKDVVMQIAYPSKFSKRKLAHLFEHEVLHTQGFEH